MRLMSSGVALVACLGGAAQKAPPGAWLGVFRPLPGARELCNQHVLGGDTPAKRFEIAFTLYGSSKPTTDVVRFYAEAHKMPFEPGTSALVVKLANGRKVLSVFRAADDHPKCGVEPRPDEPTVILVSELTSMAEAVPGRAGAADGVAELRELTDARFAANARGDASGKVVAQVYRAMGQQIRAVKVR